ncbi:MAG: low molecular weight phosphotyrosine protein phosphatase [Anaerolineae bacterium]|nr:low molecular weight phosphotyrosine protein phosphatase [Anaerolineae bacterium]
MSSNTRRPVKVMFICMGNICRSPMAEAVFAHLVRQEGLSSFFEVASSAVGSWHLGQRPHSGTLAVLKQNNIPVDPQKISILFTSQDFKRYDYVLSLDREVVSNIQYMYGVQTKRLLDYAPDATTLDVPDPYYDHSFSRTYELVLQGCKGLLAHIREVEAI